ncbi:MAG TPA: hypothetical protein VNE39_11955 [Planctomycetota bacterium]|nr:hypothetical protein [Planctomycetota bacterium]
MPQAQPPRATRGQDERIVIETDCLAAEVWPNGYVSGVKANTLVDKKSSARDASFGLDIIDFLMGPGTEGGVAYEFNNLYHGKIAKHYLELPQVCTQAKHVESDFVVGGDFVVVRQWWRWRKAAPGYKPGSLWEQTLVFPMGRRYFISCDRVESVNDFKDVFLRTDLPGHLQHKRGDNFEEVYLSYEGRIPASDFLEDFPPDGRHLYQRGTHPLPSRMIRARKIKGEGKPWLAGITLDPAIVCEAWCHQRGYICFIQEIGRLPMKPGDSFAAAYLIGYFDSIEEMEREADRYRGLTSLAATKDYWLLSEGVILRDGDGRFRIAPQGQWPAPSPWRLVAHGKGEAEINGRRLKIDGEQTFEVPWAK